MECSPTSTLYDAESCLNRAAKEKLATLRSDYESVVGRPFQYFYCPILFRDDDVPLCRAHIINSAFRRSDRRWTIQRKDVDSFLGSSFESDFVAIQERGKHDLLDVLADKTLARRLRPKVVVDGKQVDHYVPEGAVPTKHSELFVHGEPKPTRLGLKLDPSKTLAALGGKWEVRVEKDVRIAALGSLLKSAHLTLFEMLGYRYALSAGGHFLGRTVLGEFFLANVGRARSTVAENAGRHFREFVNLVRPILSPPTELAGTITDGLLYLCMNGQQPWGLVVLVRTEDLLHAVVVPALEDADSAARLVTFLKTPSQHVEVKIARFRGDRWEVSPTCKRLAWPAANL
jgi:hypothetical protein